MATKAAETGMIVSKGGMSRFKMPRDKRFWVIAATVVVIVVAIAAVYEFAIKSNDLTGKEQAAVNDVNEETKGFAKTDAAMYDVTRLNRAVIYASDKKCDEARAVYDDVAEKPAKDTDLKAYKKRIDDLCSANAQPIGAE